MLRKILQFKQGKYMVAVFVQSVQACPFVYCMVDADSVENLAECLSDQNIVLVTISGMDWENDLSPWPAERVFHKGKDFGGGADTYLQEIQRKILPEAECLLPFLPKYRVIAGYSLAGLCSLYAIYRMSSFQRVVCASASLWYDNFGDFMRENPILCLPEKIYFSLGKKEKMAKNQRMAVVEDRMKAAVIFLQQEGIQTIFEENPGGHFQEPIGRLAKGIRWAVI